MFSKHGEYVGVRIRNLISSSGSGLPFGALVRFTRRESGRMIVIAIGKWIRLSS
jgi:hypothetical protein